MASPRAPAPDVVPKLSSWGPIAQPREHRAELIVELVAARLGRPLDEVADMLAARSERHRYLLLGELGRSKHSVVHLAIDRRLAREVALKVHLEQLEQAHQFLLMREARTLATVVHEHVLAIYDVNVFEGQTYSVTELCDADMHGWSRGKPWPAILRRILEAGRGLEAVHAAGLVHGDVKPQNILIRGQVAKIGDFGLSARPGRAGQLAGTPGFIAPELAGGVRTEKADVFALACTAWACLLGRLPWASPSAKSGMQETVMFLIEQAERRAVVEPPADSEVPGKLLAAIQLGLEPAPRFRPPLELWLQGLERCLVPPRTLKDSLRTAAPLGLGLAAGLALGIWWAAPEPPEPESQVEHLTPTTPSEKKNSSTGDQIQTWSDYRRNNLDPFETTEEALTFAEHQIAKAESLAKETASAHLAAEAAHSAHDAASSAKLWALRDGDPEATEAARAIITRAEHVFGTTKSSPR